MEEPAPAPEPEPIILPLLRFSDPWELRTQVANFEGVKTNEVMSLNHIR